MNRLQLELRRLFAADPTETEASRLIGAGHDVRALVMEVTRPASWEVLGKVWAGVQTELELPPPAIAVSGVDGLQLWFSLVEPVPVDRGRDFLAALQARFLPDMARSRLRLWPAEGALASRQDRHAGWVPAAQGDSGNWSAFVAADLAPVFAETPWLDLPPSEEGQTTLLRGLRSIKPATFEAAWERLTPPPADRASAAAAASSAAAAPTAPAELSTGSRDQAADASTVATVRPDAPASDDPARFLLRVMKDDTVTLALRIEAAKALLSYGSGGGSTGISR